MSDEKDDAIHILYPGNTWLALCGQRGPLNWVPLSAPPPDSLSGCWACLNEAEKMVSR